MKRLRKAKDVVRDQEDANEESQNEDPAARQPPQGHSSRTQPVRDEPGPSNRQHLSEAGPSNAQHIGDEQQPLYTIQEEVAHMVRQVRLCLQALTVWHWTKADR